GRWGCGNPRAAGPAVEGPRASLTFGYRPVPPGPAGRYRQDHHHLYQSETLADDGDQRATSATDPGGASIGAELPSRCSACGPSWTGLPYPDGAPRHTWSPAGSSGRPEVSEEHGGGWHPFGAT